MLASFPAREVVVATMGVIFDVGEEVEEGEGGNRLRDALRSATWAGTDRPLFTIQRATEWLDVTKPTAARAVAELVELGVVGEITGRRRDRTFSYTALVACAGADT